MVAKIKSGKSLKGALAYNERKVEDGRARLLYASGYPDDAARLSFQDKLIRLQDLAARNQRTTTNTLHVSLNFPVSEKLGDERLVDIAERYMRGIGFAAQPYLVYAHFDAGHPHIHVLTTNIDRAGKRISLHNLGRNQSESTRKAIEMELGLQQAETTKATAAKELAPVRYGEVATKEAMEHVVKTIADQYRFTSVPEFNAVLQSYHVLADRGSESSVMYKQNGLRYWVTDQRGEKTGVPVKASSLKGKPTLQLLEKRFRLNSALRMPDRERVKEKVEVALQGSNTLPQFLRLLAEQHVEAVIRRTEEGRLYGLTLVDHEFKAVFKGSDLGKRYSATAISQQVEDTGKSRSTADQHHLPVQINAVHGEGDAGKWLDTLLTPSPEEAQLPAALRQKKKKKRRLHL